MHNHKPEGAKKVLVISHEHEAGGPTRSVLRAQAVLQKQGWRFSYWVPRPSELFDELSEDGLDVYGADRQLAFSVRLLRHPPGPATRLRKMPLYFSELRRAIRDCSPSLVHANSLFTLPEALLARGLRMPTLMHLHEMIPSGTKGTVASWVMAGSGMYVVAVSQASAQRIRRSGRTPPVVYESSPVPPPRARRPRRPNPLVVGTIGWVCERKGTDIFVEAAARVHARDPSIEFRIIGANADHPDAGWGKAVLQRAADLGISCRHTDDIFKELIGWDIMVMPSRFDPFPLSVLEAMATGIPVIGTAVDGIQEQLTTGAGILVPREDTDQIANEILNLARNPTRREQIGAAGRARVSGHFTPELQARALEQAYLAAGLPGGMRGVMRP